MLQFEKDIKDHHDAIVKSIGSHFPAEQVARISSDKLEDLKKGYDVFSMERLNKYVDNCKSSFIKGLEAGGDVDSLKKGLTDAQAELSSLQKVVIFDAEQKETTYYVRPRAAVAQ